MTKRSNKKHYLWRSLAIVVFAAQLMSCAATNNTPEYDYKKLAKASIRLGVDIDKEDNHALYLESASWIGVPYRRGIRSKRGTDCSGLVWNIYKNVFNRNLGKSSNDQRLNDCKKIKQSSLKAGDLVFFHNGRSKNRASHVGIYLKDRKFIHSSTSFGVIVSSLDEDYWSRHWLSAGRP